MQPDEEALSCSVCLGLLEDPTTLPCGHSYCMSCIRTYWSKGNQRRTPSCPQCRKTFTPRPVLEKNIMLADLVEQKKTSDGKKQQFGPSASQKGKHDICPHHNEELKIFCRTDQQFICYVCLMVKHRGHEAAQIAEERFEKQRKLQETRQRAQKKIQDCEQAVKKVQQEAKNINTAADKSVENSEEIFSQMIRLLQKRSSEVKQQIRSQQKAKMNRVLDLQEKLEQEIRDLKSKDREMEQLSHTEDHSQFLQRYPSLSALSESTHSSSFHLRPLRYFEEATAAVADTRDKLQELLRDKRANISPTLTQDQDSASSSKLETRENFLKYSRKITLDPDTAHELLEISEGNRKVTMMREKEFYVFHPDRFTRRWQVLSKQGLTGRCYWEVEWTGQVEIAVTFKSISREGDFDDSTFGFNKKSWALCCSEDSYTFWHNSKDTSISGPYSSRVGVYLDHGAGVLDFYAVSETMTLLHRVQTKFTKPLHVGLWLLRSNRTTAEIMKLKRGSPLTF